MKELTKTCLIGINHGNVFFLISKRLGVNESYSTPLIVAARHNDEVIINGADCIDTIRLFADSMDFSGGLISGWDVLQNLFFCQLFYDLPDGVTKRISFLSILTDIGISEATELEIYEQMVE